MGGIADAAGTAPLFALGMMEPEIRLRWIKAESGKADGEAKNKIK